MRISYILTICDFALIFGLIVSALYVVILVGYMVKMSLQWDVVTTIFPRPFAAGLIASMAYAVRRHLTRTLPSEVKPAPRVLVPKNVSATLADKPRKLYEQILASLQTRPQEQQEVEPPEIRPSPARPSETEQVSELLGKGKSVCEIGLRLLMDPVQVKETIASLGRRKSSLSVSKRTKTKIRKEGAIA